jgi:hypothetical protein
VEGLRIELRGESFDAVLVNAIRPGGEPLPDVKILQI